MIPEKYYKIMIEYTRWLSKRQTDANDSRHGEDAEYLYDLNAGGVFSLDDLVKKFLHETYLVNGRESDSGNL